MNTKPIFILIGCLAIASTQAANEVVNRVDGPWVLYKGTTKVATAPTVDQCVALAIPLNPPRKTWSCKAVTKFETVAITTPPPMPGIPPVDRNTLMKPIAGSATHDYISPVNPPLASEGAYRPVCPPTHMNFDDSLLFPGQVGASHLHVYFGNTAADASSSAASISNTGNSSCNQGIDNRSAYWTPVPIDTRTGRAIAPRDNMVYYKSGYIADPSVMVDIPDGLNIIAGNTMQSTVEQPKYISHYAYSCVNPATGTGTTDPSHPDGEYPHIPACQPGNEIWVALIFPNCWDGVHLDSDDHRKHMAYSDNATRACPATHPKLIATITYNVHYPIKTGDDTTFWRLSSDMYFGADPTKPGGVTMHGDYRAGWVPVVMKDMLDKCARSRHDCG